MTMVAVDHVSTKAAVQADDRVACPEATPDTLSWLRLFCCNKLLACWCVSATSQLEAAAVNSATVQLTKN